MSSREQGQRLLDTIDAVLEECGQDPRRRRTARTATRPAWGGPVWLRAQPVKEASTSHQVPHQRS
jgi:hypothetical protein